MAAQKQPRHVRQMFRSAVLHQRSMILRGMKRSGALLKYGKMRLGSSTSGSMTIFPIWEATLFSRLRSSPNCAMLFESICRSRRCSRPQRSLNYALASKASATECSPRKRSTGFAKSLKLAPSPATCWSFSGKRIRNCGRRMRLLCHAGSFSKQRGW